MSSVVRKFQHQRERRCSFFNYRFSGTRLMAIGRSYKGEDAGIRKEKKVELVLGASKFRAWQLATTLHQVPLEVVHEFTFRL